jgi:acetyl-CoA carboxylase biotin carboxyl carrier protein
MQLIYNFILISEHNFTLEAMKMELPVVAGVSGTVKEVKCKQGDAVEADAVLIVLE